MKENLKEKIYNIVDGKLSEEELKELIGFFKYVNADGFCEDDRFYKKISHEMSGSVKELAMMIIEFRRDLKSKIDPGITELATKFLPEAAGQLEGIIETTESAANKIMDNLELLQEQTDGIEGIIASLKAGKIRVPGKKTEFTEVGVDDRTIETVMPLIDYIETTAGNHKTVILDIFVQMSFQDLTGQRIKKIMNLVQQMEIRLKNMVVCFGVKLAEKGKNPDISEEELERVIAEKVTALAGPQKAGQGLDQADIDSLLASM